MRFTNTITIDRAPAEVFAFLARFENLPRWNYAIGETRMTSPGPVGVGTHYLQTRSLPTQSEDTFEVIEYEPDRKLSIQGVFGQFHGRLTYELEPMNNATRLSNFADLEPPGLLRLIAPLATSQIKGAVAMNLRKLKQIVESSSGGAEQTEESMPKEARLSR
jgi:uncharacterized protein YndB with AHSA1/START domain